ncbi:transcription factor Spi-C [Platysternon megacephalum]|uniref:Transcription factor Spi-C n=1 Tax=Platysternon megacephalum TaxID=55544 RepID=A0A4D9E9P1_9SAUR|nr:transcription factor Spi-C [Platysternon megacephalum]
MTVAVTQALQSCLLRRYCPPAEYLQKLLQSGGGNVHPERREKNGVGEGREIKPKVSSTIYIETLPQHTRQGENTTSDPRERNTSPHTVRTRAGLGRCTPRRALPSHPPPVLQAGRTNLHWYVEKGYRYCSCCFAMGPSYSRGKLSSHGALEEGKMNPSSPATGDSVEGIV